MSSTKQLKLFLFFFVFLALASSINAYVWNMSDTYIEAPCTNTVLDISNESWIYFDALTTDCNWINFTNLLINGIPTNITFNNGQTYDFHDVSFYFYYASNSTPIVNKSLLLDLTHNDLNLTNYYTVDNASLNLTDQPSGSYTLLVTGTGFIPTTYYFHPEPNTHMTLNVYLTMDLGYKLFYIKDLTDKVIENALVTVTQKIGGSWVTIAQDYTDVTGAVLFGLDDFTEYILIISAPGYETKTITITPVQDSYTIYLTSTDSVDFETAFTGVSYSYKPSDGSINNLYNNVSFNITFSSPGGTLEYFGLSAYYDGTLYVNNVTGSPSGGIAVIELPLFNASGSLTVNYWFKASGKDLYTFQNLYHLYNVTAGNYSIMAVSDDYFDEFSIIDRAVISTASSLFVMLICFIIGFPPSSLALIGATVYLVFSSIGFLEWWISIIVFILTLTLYFFTRGD